METQAFTEQASPCNAASNLPNSRFNWRIAACLVLWVLSLLPFLIICLLFHHKQSPKLCWFHGSSPVSSQADITWTWMGNCGGSEMNTSKSSLEILESGVYFTYVYVALNQEGLSENYRFTVELATNPNEALSILKGLSENLSFVSLGRPFFLEKTTRLYLKINDELKHIDINRTYWGVFKIQPEH